MLRHDHISVNAESETAPHTLQREFEDSLGGAGGKQRSPVITGEGDKVAVPGFLKSFQSPWHEARLRPRKVPTQPKTGLDGAPSENQSQIGKRKTDNWDPSLMTLGARVFAPIPTPNGASGAPFKPSFGLSGAFDFSRPISP